MTRDEERELLAEYLGSSAMIAETFRETCELVERLLPTATDRIDTIKGPDKIAILAFLKSFEQFEDVLQKTMKTIIQVMEQGRVERLTGVDIANRGANLGIFDDADPWSDAVRTRNALAHEYPRQPEKRVAQVNNAWSARTTLTEVWNAIQAFVARENLQ